MNAPPEPTASPQFGRWKYEYETQRWTIEPFLLTLLDAGTDDVHDLKPLVERIPEPERSHHVSQLAQAIEEQTGFAGQYPVETDWRGLATFALVGEVVRDAAGTPVELRGFSFDVTEETRRAADSAVSDATEHRRAIEQVKGALMISYGFDDSAAFALLRRYSNIHNVKLNELAERVHQAMRQRTSRPVALLELLEGVARQMSHQPGSDAP